MLDQRPAGFCVSISGNRKADQQTPLGPACSDLCPHHERDANKTKYLPDSADHCGEGNVTAELSAGRITHCSLKGC